MSGGCNVIIRTGVEAPDKVDVPCANQSSAHVCNSPTISLHDLDVHELVLPASVMLGESMTDLREQAEQVLHIRHVGGLVMRAVEHGSRHVQSAMQSMDG